MPLLVVVQRSEREERGQRQERGEKRGRAVISCTVRRVVIDILVRMRGKDAIAARSTLRLLNTIMSVEYFLEPYTL